MEAAKLTRRLRGWTAQGGAVVLATLTQSHSHNDALAVLWSRLEAGWAALVRGSGWTADKQAHGVRGYIRIAEIVHHPATGWNVHFHVILLLDRELDHRCLDGLRTSLAARFAHGVARRGGQAAVAGQDVRPMTPGTEARLASYLFKGTTMRRSADGSRTPMAILDDLESTGEGLALWDELTTAVSADKRMQVITSKGIDSLCTPQSRATILISRELIQLTPAQRHFRHNGHSREVIGPVHPEVRVGRKEEWKCHYVPQKYRALSCWRDSQRSGKLNPNTESPMRIEENNAMTLSPAAPASIGQVMESSALVPRNGFHLEPRCRVCRNDRLRKRVNDMLATGASYAMIVRALGDDNARLDPRDRVTIDSVRNHTARHFPVQSIARATYRDILERRAKENGIDFVEGVATAITPIAFFETVMAKSYENLVDSDTKVDVKTGIVAAGRLQSLIDSKDYSRDLLLMKVQLGMISEAVRSVVPQSMWGEIVEKLEEIEQHQEALVGTDVSDDTDDDPYDPTEFIDEDDELF
jgi:hypothetical protein